VPGSTILQVSQHEQEWLLAGFRRARYGSLLTLHVLLLCAVGRTPTGLAPCRFCSRSRVYRSVNPYKAHPLEPWGDNLPPKAVWVSPSLCRSLRALLKRAPSAYGWCRTRWRCAALAAQLPLQRGVLVSASTMRRWLHRLGGVWKRAQLVARDDDPERSEELARSRSTWETLGKRARVRLADELDIHLLPKPGYQWMPQGETGKVVTPGQNQKHSLAGALELNAGRLMHCTGCRKTSVLFRVLLDGLERQYPRARLDKVYVVVGNYGIHKAKAVERGLAAHPRFTWLFLPPYCPKASPIERACGDVHNKCTRNHQRKRLEELVGMWSNICRPTARGDINSRNCTPHRKSPPQWSVSPTDSSYDKQLECPILMPPGLEHLYTVVEPANPEIADGLRHIRDDEIRHREELVAMLLKSDPYAIPPPAVEHAQLEKQKRDWLEQQKLEWLTTKQAEWETAGKPIPWARWIAERELEWTVNELPSRELAWINRLAEQTLV
jgi:transposase